MDELERKIRRANPSPSRRGQALSERAERDLSMILADSPDAAKHRQHPANGTEKQVWQRWSRSRNIVMPLAAGFLVMGVIAVTVLNVWPGTAPQTMAITPPVLQIRPSDLTTEEAFSNVIELRQAAGDPGADGDQREDGTRIIRTQSWYLNIDNEGEQPTYTSPERRVTEIRGDGTLTVTVTAAAPVLTDEVAQNLPEEYPEPGELIWQDIFSAEEFLSATDPPPETIEEMRAYFAELQDRMQEPGAAFSSNNFELLEWVLDEWNLNANQESALLHIISEQPGVAFIGQTVDRLGRPGFVFEYTSVEPGEFQSVLVVSLETGKILANETIYVGGQRKDMVAPAVASYIAWER